MKIKLEIEVKNCKDCPIKQKQTCGYDGTWRRELLSDTFEQWDFFHAKSDYVHWR